MAVQCQPSIQVLREKGILLNECCDSLILKCLVQRLYGPPQQSNPRSWWLFHRTEDTEPGKVGASVHLSLSEIRRTRSITLSLLAKDESGCVRLELWLWQDYNISTLNKTYSSPTVSSKGQRICLHPPSSHWNNKFARTPNLKYRFVYYSENVMHTYKAFWSYSLPVIP